MILNCKSKQLDLSHPILMGVLNVTPDSFSDGGEFITPSTALERAREMVAQGAKIIDVGGESTRPGAEAVTEQRELDRVIPVIELIARELDVVISIDTSKAVVMRAAVAAGARFINDVLALRGTDSLTAAAELQVPVCLMHMQGEPRTMQHQPSYRDVVAEVKQFLFERKAACLAAGIAASQIIFDPGFGFGKRVEHNLTLIKHLQEFTALGQPLLIGVSRKSTIGAVLDLPVEQRLHGSTALAALAVWLGARIIRTHDVAATAQSVRMIDAVIQEHS